MSDKPSYLTTLDHSKRRGIEPMFSDFKSRGFGIEDTQIQHPDRLARLLLIMALALYCAVSTGLWDAKHHRVPAEKTLEPSAEESRTLQDLVVHPGPAAQHQATPATGFTQSTCGGDLALIR